MIKQVVNFVIVFIVFCSCRKDAPINNTKYDCPISDATNDCPGMFEIRSKAYVNLYLGTLSTGSFVPPDNQYPDKYLYRYPCLNPTKSNQICYLRREVKLQSDNDMDLFIYDVCTGYSAMIAKHAAFKLDWSSKNWILFNRNDGKLWKIKSNGDSLTQMSYDNHLIAIKWSNSGNKYFTSLGKIMDENGKIISDLPFKSSSFGWINDQKLVFINENSTQVNISTFDLNGMSEVNLVSVPGFGGRIEAIIKNNILFSVSKPGQSGNQLHYLYNLSTNKLILKSELPESCFQDIIGFADGKYISSFSLRDTMTGRWDRLNYRNHIGVSNLDGTDKREIILPE